MSQPKTASTTDNSLYVWASDPCLLIIGCFLTLIFMFKSPFRWPFPLNFKFAPSSIPRGMLISSAAFFVYIPVPEQVPQGEVIFWPSPWQELQTVLNIIMPCLKVMVPVPWQVLHFCVFVPGLALDPLQVPHTSFRENSIF